MRRTEDGDPKLSSNFAYNKCEGNVGEAIERKECYVMMWKQ